MKRLGQTLAGMLRNRVPAAYLDWIKVVGGTASRNALRGLLKILVVGFLPPALMGILRSVFSLFKILAALADLGLDYAMVTFVARALRKNDERAEREILRTVLWLKALVSIAFLVVGNLVAQRVAVWALADATLTPWVRLAFLAVGGQLLWKYVSGYLSARQHFGHVGLFLSTMPLLMLLAAAVLILVGRFGLVACILIYLLAPLVTALFWLPALQWDFLGDRSGGGKWVGPVLRFSRWIYLSSFASVVRNQANVLLLKSPRLSGSVAVGETNAGLYSFGDELANEITVFSESILTVLLPKASSKVGAAELRRFLARAYKALALIALPLVAFTFLARPAIHFLALFRESYLEYLPSVPVFQILYAGALFTVAAIPMRTAVYALRRPQIETYVEIGMIVLLVVGGVLLIPRYGPIGAAIVVLVQRVLSCLIILGYGIVALREAKARW